MNKSFLHKITWLLLIAPFLLVFGASFVQAQNELLFGQNHFYTVVFRGNGEAVAYAKIVVTNSEDEQLTEFSFEMPRVSPSELVVFQQKLPQECARFDYQNPERPCLEYRDPDYTRSYYYGYGDSRAEYQKIQYTKSGNLYRFSLPYPVEPYQSTTVILSYAAKGYVKERLGLYKFEFETLKVPSRIREIRVAVDVDSDLLLKGKRSQVSYTQEFGALGGLSEAGSISSRDLDRIVGNIGSYGPLVKEAKNLAPNESFIVKGEYATNWFRLYLGAILLTIFIVVAVFVCIYFLAKFLKKRGGTGGSIEAGVDQNAQISTQKKQTSISVLNLTNASVSLMSAVLTIGLTYLIRFLSGSGLMLPYIDPVFGIITLIATILLYVLVMFGPAIIIAIKHGWKALISILIAEFLWFVIFLILYIAVFGSGLTSNVFRRDPLLEIGPFK